LERLKNGNSLELSITGEVIFKAFWRGTRNWRLSLSPIASVFSRLGKTEEKVKDKGVLWIDLNTPRLQLACCEVLLEAAPVR
jgi:hypothetical protein